MQYEVCWRRKTPVQLDQSQVPFKACREEEKTAAFVRLHLYTGLTTALGGHFAKLFDNKRDDLSISSDGQ